MHGGEGVGDEAKIVNIEEDGEEGQDVRGWEGEVWVVALDGVNEVRDVESPEEGGEATALGQAFVDVYVSVMIGETVKDAVHERVVEGADALPEVNGDVIGVEAEEELVSRDGREGKFDISEEDDGGVGGVRSVVLVGDVGEESVDGVEGLSVGLTGALGGGEEAGLKGVLKEGGTETTLVNHEKCVSETDTAVVVWVRGDTTRLVDEG